jgi:hypothetical protein
MKTRHGTQEWLKYVFEVHVRVARTRGVGIIKYYLNSVV